MVHSQTFPSLQVVCDRLKNSPTAYHFVIWAVATPYVRGYEKEDILWDEQISRLWLAWQSLFAPFQMPHHPIPQESLTPLDLTPDPQVSISGRLMQALGVQLWQWLFQGAIAANFARSEGVALGQGEALRLRLDVRDPNLIPLPWEIMQPEMGKPAISLDSQVFFSRTIGDVAPLHLQDGDRLLRVLLVLGQPEQTQGTLDLQAEAAGLQAIWQQQGSNIQGDILLQPTPEALTSALSQHHYQLFFYSGHGQPAADGGTIYLRQDAHLNGKELAQILLQGGIRAAVFNSCWGAKPMQHHNQAIARSSLAEVLIHHGVPAVLAMRDPISDPEAIAFITHLSQALCNHAPLDQAVAIARQSLLTTFQFNSPAWTLPILYMHPEFSGQILPQPSPTPITELPTQLPQPATTPTLLFRSSTNPQHQWTFKTKLIRIGRRSENDITIEEPWVSKEHAEIIYRNPDYILRDRSRFGTLIALPNQPWQTTHQAEIHLENGSQLKFGSEVGETFQISLEQSSSSEQ